MSPTVLSAQNAPPGSNPKAQAAASTPAAADDADDLAKATQNPVASLISVPIQNNSNFAVGPCNRTLDVLNIQPVIPARISENWMIISRIIQPIVWQPDATQNTAGEYGIGDMNPTFFLSPAKPGKLIWGVGDGLPDSNQHSPRPGKVKLRSIGSRSRSTGTLDPRLPRQQRLVRRWLFSPPFGNPDDVAIAGIKFVQLKLRSSS